MDLVLVRHGFSEGNHAHRRAGQGDHSAFTPAFQTAHPGTWDLRPEGVAQARASGAWLRQALPRGFRHQMVSPFRRALATAHHMGLAGEWHVEAQLRERSWGSLEVVPGRAIAGAGERRAARASAPFFWRPPEGESLAEAQERVAPVVAQIDRLGAGTTTLIVAHGEVMTAIRGLLDPVFQRRLMFSQWAEDRDIVIANGEILWFTRRDPGTGRIHSRYTHLRRIVPAILEGAAARPGSDTWHPCFSEDRALPSLAPLLGRWTPEDRGEAPTL